MIYFLGNCYLIKIFPGYKQTPKYADTYIRLTVLKISIKITLSAYYQVLYQLVRCACKKYICCLHVAYRCFETRKLKVD